MSHIALLLFWGMHVASSAFQPPITFVSHSMTTLGPTAQIMRSSSAWIEADSLHHNLIPIDFKSLSGVLLSDISEEAAFSDSIDYFDGTIGTLLAVFGVAILVLSLLKFVADGTDSAIEEVLVDFEQTMKQSFPNQWQKLQAPLETLEGVERQQKVMEIMEGLQEDDPTLMEQVNKKMQK